MVTTTIRCAWIGRSWVLCSTGLECALEPAVEDTAQSEEEEALVVVDASIADPTAAQIADREVTRESRTSNFARISPGLYGVPTYPSAFCITPASDRWTPPAGPIPVWISSDTDQQTSLDLTGLARTAPGKNAGSHRSPTVRFCGSAWGGWRDEAGTAARGHEPVTGAARVWYRLGTLVIVDPAHLLAALAEVDPVGAQWVAEQRSGEPARVRLAFARAARKLADGPFTPRTELPAHMRGGHWRIVDLGRAVLVLAAGDSGTALVEQLYRTGELGEQESLLRMLALLPEPSRFTALASEACRTNARSVFAAIALRNPFPAAELSELAFNQMVLKSVFVGLPVAEIVGLAERATPELRRMALGYASEREAAGRSVPADVAWIVETCERGARP